MNDQKSERMKRSVRIYVTAIVALYIVATVAVAVLAPQPGRTDWAAAGFFSLLGFVAVLLSYQRGRGITSGSVSFLPFLSGILVSPTVASCVTIFFAAMAANVLQKKSPAKLFFNSSQFGIATAAAVLVLASSGRLTKDFNPTHAALFCASALVFIMTNTLLVVGAISLAERRLFWPTWQKIVSATLLNDVLALPMIALLAWSYTQLGMGWVAAVVLPLFGMRQLYSQNAQLEKVSEDLLVFMAAAHEAQDAYTSGHSRRVASYATLIARTARLPARTVESIGTAALLHDVGKIHEEYAPILRKPGKLTDEERRILETHPVKSAELVEKVGQLRSLIPAVRAHHERWDGRGYPDKLAGENIPLGARVIAIADTIDAMMSSRPYRAAMDIAIVKQEIERGRSSQFDPWLVDALLTDIAWARLQRATRRYEGLGPGQFPAWDEVERQDTPLGMPAVAAR